MILLWELTEISLFVDTLAVKFAKQTLVGYVFIGYFIIIGVFTKSPTCDFLGWTFTKYPACLTLHGGH